MPSEPLSGTRLVLDQSVVLIVQSVDVIFMHYAGAAALGLVVLIFLLTNFLGDCLVSCVCVFDE